MALATTALPFGLRDLKVTPFTTGETLGTPVDLPNIQTLTFANTSDSEELRGDDSQVAVHELGNSLTWEMSAGGLNLEAVKVMYGGTITTTGVTPNVVKTWSRLGNDVRPYFQLEGQAISDAGGDFHVKIYRAKASGDFSGELADGTFWITSAEGVGVARASDNKLFDMIHNETTTAIPSV